jgi:hypothetical protein
MLNKGKLKGGTEENNLAVGNLRYKWTEDN